MRRIFYALMVLGLLASAGLAAEPALLPDRIGAWQAEGPSQMKVGARLYEGWGEVMPGTLREGGLRLVENRSYKNGDEQLRVSLITFKDSSGAYEFYTEAIAPGMNSVGLGDESAFGSHNGAILIGNMVVLADPFSNPKPESLAELLAILKAKADRTPYPPLKSYLPVTWRVFGTERYALGPLGFRAAMTSLGQGAYADLADHVGFQLGAEAIFAKYQGAHGSGVLLLLEYPTPQIAEQHLHHLEEALPAAAKKSGVTVERKASLTLAGIRAHVGDARPSHPGRSELRDASDLE